MLRGLVASVEREAAEKARAEREVHATVSRLIARLECGLAHVDMDAFAHEQDCALSTHKVPTRRHAASTMRQRARLRV